MSSTIDLSRAKKIECSRLTSSHVGYLQAQRPCSPPKNAQVSSERWISCSAWLEHTPINAASLFTTESACLKHAYRLLLLTVYEINTGLSKMGHASGCPDVRCQSILPGDPAIPLDVSNVQFRYCHGILRGYKPFCSLLHRQYWHLLCLLSIVPTNFRPSSGSC